MQHPATASPARGTGVRRRTALRLVVVGILALLSACDRTPITPPPTLTSPGDPSRQSLGQPAASPFEHQRFSARLVIEVADLGTFSDGKPHRRTDTVSAQGVVSHGSGAVSIPANPAEPRAVPTSILVMETDAGRLHGPHKARRHGLDRTGRLVGLDFDDAADGGPVSAWRGYLDGRLVASTVYRWKRRDGRWELKDAETTLFREGVPVRKTKLSVEIDDANLSGARFGLVPQAIDGLHWVGSKAIALVAPAPLYAQTSLDKEAADPSYEEWYAKVVGFLTALLGWGLTMVEGMTAAIAASVLAAWGFIVAAIPLAYMFEKELISACKAYLQLMLIEISDYGEFPSRDYTMEVLCWGPGGPYQFKLS